MAENQVESSGSSQASQGGVFNWTDFHRTLNRAGLTRTRAAFQSSIGQLVEEVASAIVWISGDAGESYYDWMMTGSFVEGWGNNLFRLDGVTGIDSDIDWSQVVKHKVYHLKETCASVVDCINRKDYDLDNGHIHVKNCSTQPAFDTKRHGLRPDMDECQAYPCCSYPKTVLVEQDSDEVGGKKVFPEFLQILRKQFDNASPEEDVHFVRASVPGESNQMRLSCTRQERFIMSMLSTVQGQLFTILKYLFKTEEEDRNSKKKKILEHLKSFHAKTLLMTLLRDPESWLGQSEGEDTEADRLDKLVHAALELLLDCITASISEPAVSLDEVAGSSNQQEPPPPPPQVSRQASRSSTASDHSKAKAQIPRVLDHALLFDCGLYLKVKADKDKGSGKTNKSTEIASLHNNALREVLTDLVILLGSKRVKEIEIAQDLEHRKKRLEEVRRECQERTDEKGTLEAVLMKYQHEIESTLKKRGIPAVSLAGQDEADFIFIPLLMLPRINLDTLLEERKQRRSKSQEELTQDEKKKDVLSEDYVTAKASDVLMKAYVTVWIILKNLASPSKRSAEDAADKEAFDAAWNWVKVQPCLKTTFQCLMAMQLMKDGANDAEIGKILQEDHVPVRRWIKLNEDLNKFVREENCIWAFHYFIRPKDRMEFPFLNDVQGVWKGEKTWLRKEPADGGKVKHAKQEEYVDCVKKAWLTHLVFNEDNRSSKQPSLTVNFDGLLDSFRRCKRFNLQGDNTFFDFLTNCLFDPRMEKQCPSQ